MIGSNQTKKKMTNARLVASGVAFLVAASIPELAIAHRRYSSCDRSYSRRCGGGNWDNCYGNRSYRPHRRYNTAIDIFDGFLHAGMNSLSRQQRRNVAIAERHQPRYSTEDYGRSGLVLTIEVPGLKAREIDLEIVRNDGVNSITVRGNPGVRRYGSMVSPEFSQSFVLKNDIDLDGITASFSSGILRISFPRKKREGRKRWIPSIFEDDSLEDDPKSGDEILVFDSKKGIRYGTNRRSARQPVVVDEPFESKNSFDESTSIKSDEKSLKEDDLYISEEEDIW